jgi:hypothetical protein
MMSNVVQAKKFLTEARLMHKRADELMRAAMRLMTREPPIRKGTKHRKVPVTPAMRVEILRLARDPNLTIHEIGNRVGLRNSGRVSEILNGKR